MKTNKLQKKILIILLLFCLLTPAGILLPAFFNAGDAWGEWSAETVKELVGYVPAGLSKYSDVWSPPLPDYSVSGSGASVGHRSGFYIASAVFGATLTYVIMLLISRFLIRHGE